MFFPGLLRARDPLLVPAQMALSPPVKRYQHQRLNLAVKVMLVQPKVISARKLPLLAMAQQTPQ